MQRLLIVVVVVVVVAVVVVVLVVVVVMVVSPGALGHWRDAGLPCLCAVGLGRREWSRHSTSSSVSGDSSAFKPWWGGKKGDTHIFGRSKNASNTTNTA